MIIRIFTAALISLLTIANMACSPIRASGKGAENPDDTSAGTPGNPGTPGSDGSETYFRMASTEGLVSRSSELKFENGSCYLSNFYDFPDEIFGDSSLDNLTTQVLSVSSCRRLAIAEALRTAGGACAPVSVALTAQERAALQIDPSTTSALGLSSADLSNFQVNAQLSSDCVCAIDISPPAGMNGSVGLKVPPALDFCGQKFARYSAANLAAALAQIRVQYGIH